MATQIQILNEAACILHGTYKLGKGIFFFFFFFFFPPPPDIGK